MSEIALYCSCCGLMLTMNTEEAMKTCPACGTANARPRSSGMPLEMLQRATKQRLARDFHEAEISYQQVLLANPDEHEALWGRLLCRYGVEYVEDPVTRRMLPTVHSVQPKPLQEQADFADACENAPEEVAAQYRRDAAYIDDAQSEIRRLAESCPPYDVFLCHKTTKIDSTEKTEDFHRASQLYHFLKDQGVRAFFAPECMTDVAGANYEAAIYNALNTAKVMLVVCSDAAHLTSPWVRSEWTRYLSMMDEGGSKRLIPLLYDHFSSDRLPQQFRIRKLQGIDMTELNAAQKLLSAVLSATGAPAARKPAPAAPRVSLPTAAQLSQLPSRLLPKPTARPASKSAQPGIAVIELPEPNPAWKKTPPVSLTTCREPKTVPADWGGTCQLTLNGSDVAMLRHADKRFSWALWAVLFTLAGLIIAILHLPYMRYVLPHIPHVLDARYDGAFMGVAIVLGLAAAGVFVISLLVGLRYKKAARILRRIALVLLVVGLSTAVVAGLDDISDPILGLDVEYGVEYYRILAENNRGSSYKAEADKCNRFWIPVIILYAATLGALVYCVRWFHCFRVAPGKRYRLRWQQKNSRTVLTHEVLDAPDPT